MAPEQGRPGREDEARGPTGAAERPGLDHAGLFDASPNPYLVLDRRLHIMGANRAYLAATKRRLEDIVGRWAWDAFPTDPETLRQSVASFERVIRDRRPDTMALLRFDIPRPEAEGGGFEERYWSIVHAPVLDEAGEVAAVLQHPIDVSELKRLRDMTEGAAESLRLAPDQSGIFRRAQAVHEANRSLQAEGEQLRRLFEQAPGFMCVLRGPEHRFELANAAYLRLVGSRDLLGRPVREALPDLAGQGFYEMLDRVYATGEPFVSHGAGITFQRGSRPERRFVDFVCQPVTDGDGRVSGIFVQGSDVSAAERTANELRTERGRSQDILESMAEGFVLLDRSWRIVEVNAEAARLDGRPREALLGRTYWEAWPASVCTAVEAAYCRAMAERVPVTLEHHYVDEDHDLWLELRAYPSGDGLAVFFRDIAVRLRDEERLREVEARQAFLLRLGDTLRPLRDAAQIQAAACRLLGERMQVAQVGFGEVDESQGNVTIHRDWNDGRMHSTVGTWRMDDFGSAFIADMKRGQTAVIPDIAEDPRTNAPEVLAAYAGIGIRAVLDVPLLKGGRMAAVMFIHHPVPRAWSRAEVAVVEETCGRLWEAVERARAETALREREERLRLIVENARDYAILTTDPERRIDTWLPGAAAVLGWSAEEVVGSPVDIIFTPEDREAGVPGQDAETARREGVAPDVRWHLRKDGARVFIEGSTTALWNADGSLSGYLKIGQDVTGRRMAEERQALLAREVDHRAKNALAVVQSVVQLTPAGDVASFKRAVTGRISALARAQTLLAEDRWRGADLLTLIVGEVAPFLGERRAALDGPTVALPPGAAQPMAMAFHELATNAVKHGALSVAAGRLSVSWRLDRGPDGLPLLLLRWVEAGGPPVPGAPERRGFGTRVLDRTIQGQLGGRVTLTWEASGLVCELEVPLKPGPDPAAVHAEVAD